MSARPVRPVPLVSRSRPSRPQPARSGWWRRRPVALSLATLALALAGGLAFVAVRTGLIGRWDTAPPAHVALQTQPRSAASAGSGPAAAAEPAALRPSSSPAPARAAIEQATPAPTALPASGVTLQSSSALAATAGPGPLDDGVAKRLVERYYTLVDSHDLQGAYGLLGAEWRQRQSYADFVAGYRGTLHDEATITASGAAAKGDVHGYVVALDLSAQLSSRVQRYKGLYFVAVEDGQPRIISGELSPQ